MHAETPHCASKTTIFSKHKVLHAVVMHDKTIIYYSLYF